MHVLCLGFAHLAVLFLVVLTIVVLIMNHLLWLYEQIIFLCELKFKFLKREIFAGDSLSIWEIEKLRSNTIKQHTVSSAFSCAKVVLFLIIF